MNEEPPNPPAPNDAFYTDAKGRVRWHENDWLAEQLKRLHDLLVIGGYDAEHAARYNRLAYLVSRHPEPISRLHAGGRLTTLPGVGETVAGIMGELIETGTCAKINTPSEGYDPPPPTVLELTAVPRLGAKTARTLYRDHGIDSLDALQAALNDGRIKRVPGLGKAALADLRGTASERDGPNDARAIQ